VKCVNDDLNRRLPSSMYLIALLQLGLHMRNGVLQAFQDLLPSFLG
jgi:hypothetical protein